MPEAKLDRCRAAVQPAREQRGGRVVDDAIKLADRREEARLEVMPSAA